MKSVELIIENTAKVGIGIIKIACERNEKSTIKDEERWKNVMCFVLTAMQCFTGENYMLLMIVKRFYCQKAGDGN
jgi:hypothetical protein